MSRSVGSSGSLGSLEGILCDPPLFSSRPIEDLRNMSQYSNRLLQETNAAAAAQSKRDSWSSQEDKCYDNNEVLPICYLDRHSSTSSAKLTGESDILLLNQLGRNEEHLQFDSGGALLNIVSNNSHIHDVEMSDRTPTAQISGGGGGGAISSSISSVTNRKIPRMGEEHVGPGGRENRRESHKKVEQRRRERANEYFEELKRMLPPSYDVKPDKNSILFAVIDYVRELQSNTAVATLHDRLNTHSEGIEYKAAFSLAKQGIAFAGIDSTLWDVNNAFSVMVGYSRAELETKTFMMLTLQDDLEMFLGNARRLLEGGSTGASFTCRWTRKDMRIIACLIDMNLLRKEDNTPHCFILYVRQI